MTKFRTLTPKQLFISIVAFGLIATSIVTFILANLPKSPDGANPPYDQSINQVEAAPIVGAQAPDFALLDLEGELVRLADLRGHPILINFWATWCGPCRLEMPIMQQRFEEFGDQGLIILAVNFDEPQAIVQAFNREIGLTFPILLDPGAEVQRRYRMRGYPASFFVDQDGIIQAHHIGLMTQDQLDENLTLIGIGS
jgi:peroxiredoxin